MFTGINFILTDWLLLPKHSILTLMIFTGAYLFKEAKMKGLFNIQVTTEGLTSYVFLCVAIHFTQWILCVT